MAKKERKLEKLVEGFTVTIKELITGEVMIFDFDEYPADMKAKLGPFGLSHKLGDAAAGVQGQEAVDAIKKVHDGLMAANWAVRGARGESVSVNQINSGIDKLPEAEQVAARQLMLRLRILKPTTQEDIDYLASQGIEATLPVPEPEAVDPALNEGAQALNEGAQA